MARSRASCERCRPCYAAGAAISLRWHQLRGPWRLREEVCLGTAALERRAHDRPRCALLCGYRATPKPPLLRMQCFSWFISSRGQVCQATIWIIPENAVGRMPPIHSPADSSLGEQRGCCGQPVHNLDALVLCLVYACIYRKREFRAHGTIPWSSQPPAPWDSHVRHTFPPLTSPPPMSISFACNPYL